MENFEKGTFGYDYEYLSKKDTLVVLKSKDEQSQVIVSPKYQGKVFTSTAEGMKGFSFGWVNYKALESKTIDEHMNGYGGENRFWLGPEGGQYSIFFKKGVDQVMDNWYTPKAVDIEPWKVQYESTSEVTLVKDINVKNYKGFSLHVDAVRNIRLMSEEEIYNHLGLNGKDYNKLNCVAYHTTNQITNSDDFAWTPETGTVCVWMLDMFPPSEKAYTLVPYNKGDEKELGKVITSDYFGEIPEDRLQDKHGVFAFKTDGKFRSKIGLNAKRTKGVAGNYDPLAKRLTLIFFEVHKDSTYLNQEWNITRDPLVGDVLNAYNDGPLEDGSQMGPFFELESSSPAAFLKPGESLSHSHFVYHFVGDEEELNCISERILGISLKDIQEAK